MVVVVVQRDSFFTLERSVRARERLASLSSLPRLTTRDVAHTEGEPDERTDRLDALVRSLFLSFPRTFACLSFSLSLSLSSMQFSPRPSRAGCLVRSLCPSFSLSLSFSFSLSRTRTSLAFLPADAGKLSRRCQARFHPPAHKGEPKRAGQSNGAIPPVGMAGVYRRPAIGNVAFSSSVLSPFVENSRAARATRRIVPPVRYEKWGGVRWNGVRWRKGGANEAQKRLRTLLYPWNSRSTFRQRKRSTRKDEEKKKETHLFPATDWLTPHRRHHCVLFLLLPLSPFFILSFATLLRSR